MRHTRLVRVAYASRDPDFAIRACNAFAAGAEASTRAENREVSDSAVAWLEAQAESQKRELDSADQALLDARQQYQLDVLEGQRRTVQGSLLSFNEALTQVENKATLERKLLDALSAVELEPEKAGELPVDIPRAADVAGALERWRVAVSERDRLMSRYTAKHPAVQAQDQAVELYREQAMSALQRAKSTAARSRCFCPSRAIPSPNRASGSSGRSAGNRMRPISIPLCAPLCHWYGRCGSDDPNQKQNGVPFGLAWRKAGKLL